MPLSILTASTFFSITNTGIHFAAGNEFVWKREAKRDCDKFNFGIFGCWTMDENGNLDYIPKENYTDEMWNELSSKSRAKAIKL